MLKLNVSDVRPFLPAKDFGWKVTYSDDNLALLEIGNQRFYLQAYYVKEWADNAMLHVTVEDAQSCHTQIKEFMASGRFPGARVSKPKQEPYGALVTYVWDPSGVLLHLAQWKIHDRVTSTSTTLPPGN